MNETDLRFITGAESPVWNTLLLFFEHQTTWKSHLCYGEFPLRADYKQATGGCRNWAANSHKGRNWEAAHDTWGPNRKSRKYTIMTTASKSFWVKVSLPPPPSPVFALLGLTAVRGSLKCACTCWGWLFNMTSEEERYAHVLRQQWGLLTNDLWMAFAKLNKVAREKGTNSFTLRKNTKTN